MTSPTYVGSTQSGTTDTFTINKATNVISGNQTDDITILILESGSAMPAITWPAGFTEKPVGATAVTGGGTQQYKCAWKRHTGTDSGTYSASWTGQIWNLMMAVTIRGCINTGDPIEDIQTSNNTSGTTVANITVTTTDTDFLLFIGIGDSNAGPWDWTPPTGPAAFTEVQDNDYDSLAYLEDTASGSRVVSGATFSATGAHGQMVMALKPTAAAGSTTMDPILLETGTNLLDETGFLLLKE